MLKGKVISHVCFRVSITSFSVRRLTLWTSFCVRVAYVLLSLEAVCSVSDIHVSLVELEVDFDFSHFCSFLTLQPLLLMPWWLQDTCGCYQGAAGIPREWEKSFRPAAYVCEQELNVCCLFHNGTFLVLTSTADGVDIVPMIPAHILLERTVMWIILAQGLAGVLLFHYLWNRGTASWPHFRAHIPVLCCLQCPRLASQSVHSTYMLQGTALGKTPQHSNFSLL